MDWKEALSALNLPQEEENSPVTSCEESVPPSSPAKKGRLQIVIEKKGRAGKTATIICGFGEEVTDEEIASLAARLKKRLSTGGSARGGEILIQGERRDEVSRLLREEGYKVN